MNDRCPNKSNFIGTIILQAKELKDSDFGKIFFSRKE